jgi:hypothetical protein
LKPGSPPGFFLAKFVWDIQMSARFGGRPFAILVAVQMRGELTLGSSAMTLRDAQQIAHGLIQGYIGPDHRVIDMSSFYSALAQALQTAYRQGRNDRVSESQVSRCR